MLDICKNIRDIIDSSCDDEKLEKFVNGYMDMGYIDLGHPFLCEYAKLANVLMLVIDKIRPYLQRADMADTCVEILKKDDRLKKIYHNMVMGLISAYNEGVLHGYDKKPDPDGK